MAFPDGTVEKPRLEETMDGWTLHVGDELVFKDVSNRDIYMALMGFISLRLPYRKQFINAASRIA